MNKVGNMKTLKFLIFVFCVLSLTNFSLGQEGDAGQAGEFLRYGVGGRALGMGRAYVTLANDASGIYWNPAGVIGSERKQFSSMYTNLFYDTRYTYLALSLPRLIKRPGWLPKVLFGPRISFGIGLVDLSTADFDQRDENNISVGSFGIHNRAFLLSFSTERVTTWGIFNYGWTFKKIDVAIPGLQEYDLVKQSWWNPIENTGIDFGFLLQPINFFGLKELFSLKCLMPFKLGFNIQNLVSPKVKIKDKGETERYLPSLRLGWSYALNISDRSKLIIANDFDKLFENIWILDTYDKRKCGVHAGFELQTRFRDVMLCPRIGFNNLTEKFTCGGGLQFPLTSSAALKMDYAYGDHGDLGNDHRFFFTL